MWYVTVHADDSDEDKKKDHIAKYGLYLIIIGVCMLLLAIALICVRNYKWISRLEQR
jgi:hypothetical protein